MILVTLPEAVRHHFRHLSISPPFLMMKTRSILLSTTIACAMPLAAFAQSSSSSSSTSSASSASVSSMSASSASLRSAGSSAFSATYSMPQRSSRSSRHMEPCALLRGRARAYCMMHINRGTAHSKFSAMSRPAKSMSSKSSPWINRSTTRPSARTIRDRALELRKSFGNFRRSSQSSSASNMSNSSMSSHSSMSSSRSSNSSASSMSSY